jgi:hypothetical protein
MNPVSTSVHRHLGVQDAIAERITTSLLRGIDAGQRAARPRRETENAEAYDRRRDRRGRGRARRFWSARRSGRSPFRGTISESGGV